MLGFFKTPLPQDEQPIKKPDSHPSGSTCSTCLRWLKDNMIPRATPPACEYKDPTRPFYCVQAEYMYYEVASRAPLGGQLSAEDLEEVLEWERIKSMPTKTEQHKVIKAMGIY